VDVVEVASILSHSNPTVTLTVYAHALKERHAGATALDKLAAFRGGGRFVVSAQSAASDPTPGHMEVAEQAAKLLVARGGIEPPTRGFSVRIRWF
jgi:hypothetical protein